ncbi:hypothetical protein BofuT4_uP088740.1 [Botrytis cinerea T4]|uniref:Uncharacterized protein n=1 Tax=Botryotinia fuckeliana (strain T4) TaxID=999810 RepID=G2YFC7_BOTF4|nr:hypothetical protein BofuT4_uP088740.1 [Botrytis cinerea T4]
MSFANFLFFLVLIYRFANSHCVSSHIWRPLSKAQARSSTPAQVMAYEDVPRFW